MNLERRCVALALSLVAVLILTACPNTKTDIGKPEKHKDILKKVAVGFSHAPGVLAVGRETVRDYRIAGDISPALSLELARGALEVNGLLGEGVGAMLEARELDEAGRLNVVGVLERLIPRARRLVSEGKIKIKDGTTRLVFDLSTIGGIAAIQTMRAQLASLEGEGLKIEIDEEMHRRLIQAREAIAENDRRLRDSIRELEALTRP